MKPKAKYKRPTETVEELLYRLQLSLYQLIESYLNKEIYKFEKKNLSPILTKTDILLIFSRIYDKLKDDLTENAENLNRLLNTKKDLTQS